uniref:Uncharacterized protein n=1 Tax=Acrobeloides nanus TaxID=290746 RepID=A0A914DMT1_9BILA
MKLVNITTVGTTQVDIQSDLNSNNITLNNNDGFVLRAVLLNQNNDSQTPVAILLPQKLRQISNPNYGDAIISSITKIIGCSEFNCYLTFAITLNASKIVPVLWVDIKPEVKEKHQLIYWFSDNAFTMTTPQVRVDLKIFYTNDSSLQLTTQDLIITRMKMRSSKVPDQRSTQSTTNPTSTLSTINLISTKSSTNLTTTQSASQADEISP